MLSTIDEFSAWKQRCDEFIESLEEQNRIKRPRLSINNRQSLIACITRFESLKESVREDLYIWALDTDSVGASSKRRPKIVF